MLKILGLSGLIVLSLMTTGCSLDSALFGVNPAPGIISGKSQAAEIVSGSTQYRRTAGLYYVSASAGSIYEQVQGRTPQSNYKVFITVQGQMLAEEQ